jgi:biopolymer transport protein TolQ
MGTFQVWQIITDTSPFGLFILIVLVTMSLASWAVIFNKWRHFRAVEHANEQFLTQFKRSRKLGEAVGQAKSYGISPLSNIYKAGFEELARLHELRNEAAGLKGTFEPVTEADFEIVEMTMERAMTEQRAVLERRVVFLATTGSSAPFLGLLGTVVGIMGSFWSIGERGSASLAIVAPGIAEALLATIVGLGAAIPAVIAYNWANNKLRILGDRSSGFILEFIARARKEARA